MKMIFNSSNPFRWRLYIGKYYSITLKKLISLIPALMMFYIYTGSTWISKYSDKVLNSIERWCHDE